MDDAFGYCQEQVKVNDRDRFLATLFATADRRPLLYALYAFDLEIAGLAARLREPLAGELRLQWWREVIEGSRAEEAAGHPVARGLLAAMAQAPLSRDTLLGLLDARSFDLYGEPIASVAEFDAHAMAATGNVLKLAAGILGAEDSPVLNAAVAPASAAIACADAVVRFAAEASRGHVSVPLEILARHGATAADATGGRATPAIIAALAEVRQLGLEHFEVARHAVMRLPVTVRPAFLHVSLVPLFMTRAARIGSDPFQATVTIAPWRRQWALWRASRTWLR